MNWRSLVAQLGPYVWLAYGFAAMVFLFWVLSSRRCLLKIKKQLRERDES